MVKDQNIKPLEPIPADSLEAIAEVGEGVYYEINGVSRPNELQGIPRAELAWVPRLELSAVSERYLE